MARVSASLRAAEANAAEAYEDIDNVIIESLVMPEAQLTRYLDTASSRGEIARPLAVSDAFDLSLMRSLN